MARYFSIEEAEAAGFTITHDTAGSQFVIAKGEDVVGTAKYRLTGDTAINFNSTVVDPSLRGTGLAGLLVETAVGDDLVRGRTVHATCWFVAGYLERHPEKVAEGATIAAG